MQEALKKMKELTRTLKEQKEVVKEEAPAENEDFKQFMDQLNELTNSPTPQNKIINTPQSNNQGLRSRYNVSPPPNRIVPYVPAQNVPKFAVKCYYCMEEGHSVVRCTELVENKNKKWVITQDFNYLYPNWERVPNDGKFPPKYLVREFQKEHEELKRKLEEKNKEEEQKKKEKSTAFISMDNWGDWEPPCISTELEEPFGYAYGLRNTKQRIENQEKSKAQSLPSKETIQPKDTIKKKTSIPGGFIEEEEAEEEKVIIPTKYKSSKSEEVVKPPELTKTNPNTSAKEKETDRKALIKLTKVEVNKKPLAEEEGSIIEKVMKKVMDQKINLTLEEIVTISPKFMQELKFLSDKERKYLMSLKSINSQEQTTTQEIIIQDKMHYSCPLGMIEVSVGQEGHIVKALVDTGAELSIIPEVESIKARLPMRVLNMRLRGIGGHSTAIVGLSENTLLVLPSGDERRIHFFVARGAVHTVIGRPLLADNGIRLEHSQQQGEILSYKESVGRRLCIPISTPESEGWHTGPPRGIELCNSTQIEEWKINNISRVRRLEKLPQGNPRKEENQVSMKQNQKFILKIPKLK
ncbi:hypothetical protein O181_066122 [Austropuccinia psidii MF-1]|uniref:Peptidase A2 domain-containing protein n=1 Tax=Austropuccinia psidii MF-1 TaxID=1389203 RepID=A0A9Q3I3Z1_9BASI|nr:hypothetical protein [Austropuccinia psidii MF-1]